MPMHRAVAAGLRIFQASLPRRVRETRRPLEAAPAESLADFDTAAELLYRFVDEWIRYSETYASLARRKPGAGQRTAGRYVSKTNGFVVAFTFARSAAVMAIAGWFWIATDWPSGGLAVIGAALVCALTSTAPNASKMAVQMAVGAVLATMTGYLFTCYVYPNIDGFPLLCAMLAPVLALGAFIASRKLAAGYGIGFSVFFCLLAGPDNVVTYAPDLLINNGIAITASLLLAAIVFAVVFPADMPWLTERIKGDLRAQVVSACKDELPGLNQRFQSSTHDLTSQLRMLLTRRSRRRRDALRWMLVTLEVGHAVIDLRNEAARAELRASASSALEQRPRADLRRPRAALCAAGRACSRARARIGALGHVDRAGRAGNRPCRPRQATRPAAHPELPAFHPHGVAR